MNILITAPCIINGWFSPTYENPRGFSIRFLFAKLRAKPYTNTLAVIKLIKEI